MSILMLMLMSMPMLMSNVNVNANANVDVSVNAKVNVDGGMGFQRAKYSLWSSRLKTFFPILNGAQHT